MIELDDNARQSFNYDGFVLAEQLVDSDRIDRLRQAFDDLFYGTFETGVRPDEINWQQADGDPTRTRQICNGWKANREIAAVVLDESLGDNHLDENYFPILWREDGYRTPQIETFLGE